VFFDYAYLLVAKFYARHEGRDSLGTSAIVVSALQAFNVWTILVVVMVTYYPNENLLKIFFIGSYFLIYIRNCRRWYRQEEHSATAIEEKWRKKRRSEQREIKSKVLWYVLLSVISLLSVVLYLGKKNSH
jgi:hypothetical protein